MGFQEQYTRRKAQLLADTTICVENRELFAQFFEFEEHKLKRINGLAQLDEPSYSTLYFYTIMLCNANRWLGNQPWEALTKGDIQRVYDGLEDGTITNCYGLPVRNRHAYYNKIFKSKPFRLARKAELAREVIEFSTKSRVDAHFITEETFRTMVSVLSKPRHLLLFWLAWDIGENIGALLQLSSSDLRRQINRTTGEAEYLVRLPQRKIKRSRQERTEPTLYPETARYADMVFGGLVPSDRIFPFGHRQALKLMHNVVTTTCVKREPDGAPPTWKDLRSGMACHMLKLGCSREEVQARLGHRPGSDAIDAYVNFMAIDRERPKQRIFESSVFRLQRDLESAKQQERVALDRVRWKEAEIESLHTEIAQTHADLQELREHVEQLLRSLTPRPAISVQGISTSSHCSPP